MRAEFDAVDVLSDVVVGACAFSGVALGSLLVIATSTRTQLESTASTANVALLSSKLDALATKDQLVQLPTKADVEASVAAALHAALPSALAAALGAVANNVQLRPNILREVCSNGHQRCLLAGMPGCMLRSRLPDLLPAHECSACGAALWCPPAVGGHSQTALLAACSDTLYSPPTCPPLQHK